jgi:hypothetical protein
MKHITQQVAQRKVVWVNKIVVTTIKFAESHRFTLHLSLKFSHISFLIHRILHRMYKIKIIGPSVVYHYHSLLYKGIEKIHIRIHTNKQYNMHTNHNNINRAIIERTEHDG